jgi:hypothetical protein
MIVEYPHLRTHFNPQSSVSLALPRSWVSVHIENGNLAALYIDPTAPEPAPRLAIQIIALGDAQPDAYQQVAGMVSDASRPQYGQLSTKARKVDGYPAITQVAKWQDQETSVSMVEHVTTVQAGGYLFVLIGMGGAATAEPDLVVFEGAINSVRFILPEVTVTGTTEEANDDQSEPPLVSYFDANLGLSLLAPRGWVAGAIEAFPLNFFAPEEKGYRAHLSFGLAQLDAPDLPTFEALMLALYPSAGLALEEYRLHTSYAFTLDDRPAFLARYDWFAGVNLSHLAQVDVLVWVQPNICYKVHGYALLQTADRYMPVFADVISSIRFISV